MQEGTAIIFGQSKYCGKYLSIVRLDSCLEVTLLGPWLCLLHVCLPANRYFFNFKQFAPPPPASPQHMPCFLAVH